MCVDYAALLREWSCNYRSFSRFKKRVGKENCSQEYLEAFACLLEKDLLKEKGDKGRFSRRFFKTYGDRLKRPDGCSRPVLDHQRVRIMSPDLFLAFMDAFCSLGVVGSSKSGLAAAVDSGFDTGYSHATLKRMLYEGSSLSDTIYKELKRLKVVKTCRKRP